MSLLRFCLGLLLVPLCVSISLTAVDLVTAAQTNGPAAVPASALALGGGYLLWLAVYFTLPKPYRTYVFAHELTHALWGALMGARIFKVSVTRHKGSVTLSKTNFLITLAPYFFPLYTVLAIVAYYALSIFYPLERYQLWWLGLVGFTWGFHFSFTVMSLMQRQSDIEAYGRLFSYTVIYLFNVIGIGFWIVMVSVPTLEDFVSIWLHHNGVVFRFCHREIHQFVQLFMQ